MVPGAQVQLEPHEAALFDTLTKAAAHQGLSTTLRCAGGWVRDKLLGKTSPDIDIALDDILGAAFAEHVNAYLADQGQTTHGVGVIQSNPDQSKHLETARMRIQDVWIDLVNLRSEDYAQDSRIPEMTFGTPEQDALRRDLTINALFYNLHTKAVEDFTGRGLADLDAGRICTPLPPRETFLDDPLRALRAVRFAARFGFVVVPDLLAASADPEVLAALDTKVSRERVGTEIVGMCEGPDPTRAMELLHEAGLAPSVFRV